MQGVPTSIEPNMTSDSTNFSPRKPKSRNSQVGRLEAPPCNRVISPLMPQCGVGKLSHWTARQDHCITLQGGKSRACGCIERKGEGSAWRFG
eukprot:1943328-Rhodomonas_salina.2